MKQFLSYMIVALAALWMAGCSDDSLSPADQPERGIVIRLSTGDLETRTDLTSQANLQHVTEVYALLYDGTGNNATFVSVEKLDWNLSTGGNGFRKKDFTLPQTATAGLSAGSYTILCVGLDDNSGATYGLTAETMKWSTLAEAKATLAAEKTADDIAHSELFAGWAEFDFEPDNINIVEVEMKRRVAGVLCYLKDIPSTLTKSDGTGTYTVTKVLLRLFSDQCDSIVLPRKEKSSENTGLQDDFGEGGIKDSDVLMSYDLSKCEDLDSDGLYEISVAEDESRLPNTILMGAYMLPIEYFSEDNKPTFTLEIWGTGGTSGSGLQTNEKLLQSFPVYQNGLSSGSDAERYSIYPNYIYHIGDKPDPNSTDGDQPMSLAGTKITVKPEPWTEMDVDVDFPSVPVNATMELTYGGVSVNDDYIFDCIGTYNSIDMNEDEPLRLKVNPSVLGTSWELFIAANSGVYVKNPADNKFVDGFTYKSVNDENTKGKTFDLLLTDYINTLSNKPLDEDYREIKINLTTYDKDGKPLSFVQELVIKQYNAVIIAVTDKKEEELRAFSRYDYNSSELMSTEGTAEEWGYYENVWPQLSNVYHNNLSENSDGFENFYSIKENAEKTLLTEIKKDYNNSLVKKIIKDRVMISNGIKSTLTTFSEIIDEDVPDIWYLPARNELANFLFKFSLLSDSQQKQSLFVQTYDANKAGYWTSNATGSWISLDYHSYYNYVKNDGTLLIGVDGSDSKAHTHRSSKYYARRACRIE